jgi:hypothetical protein
VFVPNTICKYHGILFETEICEHHLFDAMREFSRGKLNGKKANLKFMDKVESNDEALLVECHEAFVIIREKSDPLTLAILFSLIFIIVIPFFTIEDLIWGDNTLCCGSVLLGIALIIGGTIQSIAHWSRYKSAAQDLAHAAGIHDEISYPFFSILPPYEKIYALVLQKYPFLNESREKSNKTKPRKVVLSKREED